jgi:hypothetical protein
MQQHFTMAVTLLPLAAFCFASSVKSQIICERELVSAVVLGINDPGIVAPV